MGIASPLVWVQSLVKSPSGQPAACRAKRGKGAEPDARALEELRDVGVTWATLYAPSAGTEEVLRFLDDVAPLVDETKAA